MDFVYAVFGDLPITGAAISVFGGTANETTFCTTDPVAARLDELQFDLGEGPRQEAVRSRRPVLIPHLRDEEHAFWPVFGQALLETEAAALFVFPLIVGSLDVGVVELYRSTPGPLRYEELAAARLLAGKTAWAVLDHVLTLNSAPSAGSSSNGSPLSRREIHQATGMVIAQTASTPAQALQLLRAHAFSQERTVREIAVDVVARTLDFTHIAEPGEK